MEGCESDRFTMFPMTILAFQTSSALECRLVRSPVFRFAYVVAAWQCKRPGYGRAGPLHRHDHSTHRELPGASIDQRRCRSGIGCQNVISAIPPPSRMMQADRNTAADRPFGFAAFGCPERLERLVPRNRAFSRFAGFIELSVPTLVDFQHTTSNLMTNIRLGAVSTSAQTPAYALAKDRLYVGDFHGSCPVCVGEAFMNGCPARSPHSRL